MESLCQKKIRSFKKRCVSKKLDSIEGDALLLIDNESDLHKMTIDKTEDINDDLKRFCKIIQKV